MATYATESNVQMTGAGLLGRDTASVGLSERITIGSGLTLSGGELVCTLNPAGYLTIVDAAANYQPLNVNLTTISGLSPSNDDFLQRKAGAWANRTIAQVKTDLGLSGTNTGDQDLSSYATIAGSTASFVALAGSYANPAWITSLAWSKISSTPTTLSGYSISDAYPLTGNPSGFLVSADLSSYITSAAAAAAYQPLNSNLTTVSGLSPSNDDFLQRKAGAWANRTIAQVKTDLGLSGTNSGDQTITLTGDVTGSGTGSFAATIANAAVTLGKMADMSTASVFYRKTAGTGAPEVQTLATLKTDLGLAGTNTGDQTITLSGDVTGSGTGSFAATIATASVSLSKMADMATSSLIYRKTAGTGVPEVQTLATLKTDLGLSGTNTGDQTSIVGITGTKAQFDTACSDGNFLYVGDVTGLSDGDKGDITVSSSGAVWGIDAGAVSLSKLADMATASVYYRKTAGTGSPEVQSLATLKTDLGLTGTNTGDQDLSTYVPYTGASTNVNLGTNSLSCGAITMDGLFTTQAMILTGSSHQAWFKALNVGGVFRIQADPTSGIGVNITSTAIHPLDSNYTLGANGSGFVAAHIGNSGAAAVIKASANTIVIRNEADSAAGALSCGTVACGAITTTGDLLFTDATYDIGKSGTTRPRDLFISRNLTVGGTVSCGAITTTGDLLFTDATYDIGKSGATRPRDLFLSRNLTVGGTVTCSSTIAATGNITSEGLLSSDRYGVSANYRFRRANGTSGSPSQVTSGQAVGALSSFGYHSSAFHSSAGALIYFIAAESYTSGAHGTNIQFWTTPATGASTTAAKRVTFEASGEVTLEAGSHLQTSGAGFKIGTATSQKVGFWNATPVVQQTTASAAATRTGGGGTTLTDTDTFDGYTVAQVVKVLRTIGVLA